MKVLVVTMLKRQIIAFLLLLSILLAVSAVHAQSLVSTSPDQNAGNVAASSNIVMTFDSVISAGDANADNIVVQSSSSGLVAGVFSGGGGMVITFDPTSDFAPGELVTVTITTGVGLAIPHSFQFRIVTGSVPEPIATVEQIVSTAADSARSVHVGDMDGDGDLDILSSSSNDDTVAWYENDGTVDPTFTERIVSTAADGANSVHVGDVDGDGDLDILSASEFDNTIAWYENDGAVDPTFTKQIVSTTASLATSVHVGDMDGDGDLDILSASSNDDTIAWYENDGAVDPAFTERIVSTTADGAQSVHVGDVDGDGDLDILSASSSDDTIAWYENDGAVDPTFTERIVSTAADGARSVHAGDVDGDGDLDILSASSNDDTIAWYENDGTVDPMFTERIVSTTADGAFSVYVGDVDGDGHLDILSASFNDSTIAWYENDGAVDPTFTERIVSTAVDGAANAHVGDVDGDGDLDILSVSESDDTIAWYEVRQRVTLVSTLPDQNAENVAASSNIVMTFDNIIPAVDVNADNIVVQGSSSGLVAGVLSGVGSTVITFNPASDFAPGELVTVTITTGVGLVTPHSFQFRIITGSVPEPIAALERIVSTAADAPRSVHVGDMDRDGDLDILSASSNDNTIAWYENDGAVDPTFTEQIVSTTANFALSVYVGDVDGDGDLDILSASEFDSTIAWYENDGAVDPTFTKQIVSTAAIGAQSVHAGDVDGDGDLDVLSASSNDDTIAWYENDGAVNPTFTERIVSTAADGAASVHVGDMDGDGDLDILSASVSDDTIAWYENDGAVDPTFTERIVSTAADGAFSVYVGDVDGDGDLDILSASLINDIIAWYENDGAVDPMFTERIVSTTADGARSVHVGDVDGDGDLDILSASESDDTIAWYENDGAVNPTFTERIVSTAADRAQSVHVGDVDGDGDLDILSASFNDDTIAWYEVRQRVTLVSTLPDQNAENVAVSSNIVMSFDNIIPAVDVNTDNIVVQGSSSGLVTGVLSGIGSTVITFNPASDFAPGELVTVTITTGVGLVTPHSFQFRIVTGSVPEPIAALERIVSTAADAAQSVHVGDMDRDGDLDILSASFNDSTIAWYENDGAVDPTFTERIVSMVASGAASVHVGDVDGDGDLDIFSASFSNNTIAWYENDGAVDPTFTERMVSTAAIGARSVYVGDMDGDGDLDILSASESDDTIAWYENDGAVDPTFTERIVSTAADGARSVHVGDMDGDGDLDILSASFFDDTIAWYENDGAVDPTFTERIVSTAADGAFSVYVGDVDGDGDLDILSASSNDDTIAWYENDGAVDPMFTERIVSTAADVAFSVHVGDVDGNGDLDILSASAADDTIAWYENDGAVDPTFTERIVSTAADFAQSVHVGDVDGDGDLDILSGSFNDDTIAWYEIGTDTDSDGVLDNADNCPNNPNPTQEDNEGDGLGDVCDPDDDNDGLTDVAEGVLGTSSTDADSDGDGIQDNVDPSPTVFNNPCSLPDPVDPTMTVPTDVTLNLPISTAVDCAASSSIELGPLVDVMGSNGSLHLFSPTVSIAPGFRVRSGGEFHVHSLIPCPACLP